MSVVRSNFTKTFSSETTRQIKAKFYVKLPWVGGNESLFVAFGSHYQDGATPIYGKTLQNRPNTTKLGMKYWGLQAIIVCTNDEPGLILTYFTARSNIVTKDFL